ncbi:MULTISPECIES: ABC transporter substrate-binding protein [Brucella]|uniref:Cell processes transport of small molecules amino acids, amines, peptides n=1 Tax=Ochrobactrum soli TaxID=2448455 RepID=A0A2P9HFS0_9HYPH|nr:MULTISPECIES: ABC transporter substrate-binding protein [Brucella]RRD27043.1 ABC transporter substrate-binding protein [Brucellaceae bacterium VT-16-1752]WHT43424.1 ABC transporter substrate-binding protein [Ochrobactrum sp. SSR]MDX4074688.1 ABC transporter substrate-binding protein [Brucella sp. NBRC 113783]WHS33322.1 ABC transporter substrate-binding protein [Brucella sp. NM4]SPL62941.1 cell processes; transport of small molecules; amino acids, amines, peptides [[Ochrobactrum] soli]
MLINRRHALGLMGAAAGTFIMPGVVRANQRRSVTVAVQKITNNNTLDIWNEQSNVGERVFFPNLWEGLILRDWMGNQGPVPGLATEWKRLDDKTIELKLRQGVKFHNGDELTAEDVVFSFSDERLFAGTEPAGGKTLYEANFKPQTAKELPAAIPGISRRLWPALRGVEAVDKYTVRFHNATPDVTLEGRLYAFGSQIANKRAWDESKSYAEWARKPVTTGPYKVADYKPDVELVLEAHDEYWGGQPPLQQIRFVEVPEVASRVNGLISGQYDFACDLPPDQISTVTANPGLEIQSSTIWNHRITVFNTQNEILRNPLVRRAMTHSIDRQAIVDALWAGQTVVPAGMQFESFRTSDMFIDDWQPPKFDPELARDLLKQANYKGDAIPYRLLNNYYTNQTPTAQVLVEMWKQVGLNVEIEMKENWAQVHDPEGVKGVRDWSASNNINDPITPLVVQFGPNGEAQQKKDWSNDEVNKLSVIMETSTDRDQRKKAIKRMLEICEREDPAYNVLHQNAVFTGMKKELNWKAAPAFAMDFRSTNWNV